MNKNLCPHCDPYTVDSAHVLEKIEGMLSALTSFLVPVWLIDKTPQVPQSVNKVIIYSLLRTLLTLRVLQEIEANRLDEGIRNRSLVVVREAQRRGISVKALKVFGRAHIGIFSLEANGVKRFFDDLPHATIERVYPLDLNDKEKVKKLLRMNDVPTPRGSVSKGYHEALRCVEEIGFPVVVKPRAGSLSRHTTCDIKTNEELKDAVRVAQIISRELIVEEFISGDVYRATVVVVAHRLSTIRKMDRIVVLKDGAIIEEGTHDDLTQQNGSLYAKLWDLQAGGFLREGE